MGEMGKGGGVEKKGEENCRGRHLGPPLAVAASVTANLGGGGHHSRGGGGGLGHSGGGSRGRLA